jgi:hypothetical protein
MNNVLNIDINHTLEQPKAINDYQIILNLLENSKDPNYEVACEFDYYPIKNLFLLVSIFL